MDKPIPKKEVHPHRLNSLRHPGADYSQLGAYFVTLCTRNRQQIFGEIHDEQMLCNIFGMIVWEIWKNLPLRYPQISIDSAIVMPDHFHGILVINSAIGAVHDPPLLPHSQPRRIMTIPIVVGYFKMNTAKQINLIRNSPGISVWQRNYYDRIIESEEDCDVIKDYILTNPSRWGLDKD